MTTPACLPACLPACPTTGGGRDALVKKNTHAHAAYWQVCELLTHVQYFRAFQRSQLARALKKIPQQDRPILRFNMELIINPRVVAIVPSLSVTSSLVCCSPSVVPVAMGFRRSKQVMYCEAFISTAQGSLDLLPSIGIAGRLNAGLGYFLPPGRRDPEGASRRMRHTVLVSLARQKSESKVMTCTISLLNFGHTNFFSLDLVKLCAVVNRQNYEIAFKFEDKKSFTDSTGDVTHGARARAHPPPLPIPLLTIDDSCVQDFRVARTRSSAASQASCQRARSGGSCIPRAPSSATVC
jgi:hypothetical protein